MKKIFFLVLCNIEIMNTLVAQESYSKISLSGFTVNLTQSDKFNIEVDTTFATEKKVENGVLYIGVIDQTGQIPKSTISICVNKLNYLSLHNSKLVMDSPITVDTLEVELACAFGTLKVNADSLNINAGAASQFSCEGSAKDISFDVGAASNLSASKFIADRAKYTVMGHSQLYIHAENVVSSKCDKNSMVKNLMVKNFF